MLVELYTTVAPVLIASAVAVVVIVCTVHRHGLGCQKKRYPPGPAGLPLFGNYFQLSTGHWNDKFTKWGSIYGTYFTFPVLMEP